MQYKSFMPQALEEADRAFLKGEVPVGAVIVRAGEIIASAHNLTEQTKNPLAHAEILAINKACRALGSMRLNDCELYVTLEPCPMCAGAILNARLKRLYIGAPDVQYGCCGSAVDLTKILSVNHNIEVYHGIMEAECEARIKQFFQMHRKKYK